LQGRGLDSTKNVFGRKDDGLLEDNNAIKNLTDPVKVEKDASLDIDEVS